MRLLSNKLYKKILIILTLTVITFPVKSYGADDFWGENSSGEPASVEFDESSVKTAKTIKAIEIHGLNVISQDLVMQKLTLHAGDEYNKETLQSNLKSIYDMGFFSEKMKAIPVTNSDGTVTIKIILEENAPITDFTIEGNTVVSTEEILQFLLPLKGKPQNITEINSAIVKIQNLYNEKGYILARVDSVTDDPDGTVNISLKEGTIDKIMISGNEKTKDYIIEHKILT